MRRSWPTTNGSITLGELGLDRLSTEGAAERNKAIAPDIAAPLIAAVVKTTGIGQDGNN